MDGTGVFKSSREATGNKKAAITEQTGAGAWDGVSSVFGSYVVKQAISFKKMKECQTAFYGQCGGWNKEFD